MGDPGIGAGAFATRPDTEYSRGDWVVALMLGTINTTLLLFDLPPTPGEMQDFP